MGCGASSIQVSNNVVTDNRFGNQPSNQAQFQPQFQQQPQWQQPANGMDRNLLNMAADAILRDDVALVNQYLQQIRPYDNVKTDGTFSSCLHEAAYNNAAKAMEAYARWLKTYEGNRISAYILKEDTNRSTVTIAAITNNSADALYVMLCEGLINTTDIVMKGKDLTQICKEFSHPCTLAVERYNLRGQPNQDENWLAYKRSQDPTYDQPAQVVVQPVVVEEKVSKEEKWDEEAFKRKMEQRRKEDEEWEKEQARKREEQRKRDEERQRREEEEMANTVLQPAPSTSVTKEIYATMSKREDDGKYYITRTEGSMPNWGKPLPYEDPVFVKQGVPAKSEIEEVLDLLADGHVNLYIDAQLPTTVESLTKDPSHNLYSKFSQAEWKRPNVFFETDFPNIKVFDKISPNDISQGVLGVCYMLSSLAAIAEFPKRLEKIFLNTFVNKWGVYGVRYYLRGIPSEVIVDDRFPCYQGTNKPLFAKPKGKELWVMIAEKAWAKVYKSYAACEHGYMDEALEYITGAPAVQRTIKPEDSDDSLWNQLYTADQKNYIVCAATKSSASQSSGMVANHAYSVISAHDVNGQRILKLRNPWGKFEWNGDYSDNSPLWTPELKTKLGYVSEDDGVFFMSLPDFRRNFEYYTINMYYDDYQYSYTKAEAEPRHAQYYTINVDKPCSVYFRVHFKDCRHLGADRNAYNYPSADIILAKVEGKNRDVFKPVLDLSVEQHQGSVFGARSVYASKDLKLDIPSSGEYMIRIKVRGEGQKTPYTLSAYSPIKFKFEKSRIRKDFMPSLLENAAQKAPMKAVGNDGKMGKGNYLNYFFVYLLNEGAKTWNITIKFDEIDNLRFPKKYKKGNQPDTLTFKIPSKSTGFAYLKKDVLTQGTSYKWSVSSSFS